MMDKERENERDKNPEAGKSSSPEENTNPGIEDELNIGKTDPQLEKLAAASDRIRKELHKLIVGQDDVLDLLMISLFAGGHAMIEGVPGIAKTLTAKLLARTLKVDYNRIQFTPDLMPADVLGTNVFNMKKSDFQFNAGPVFTNILLIDEINRAPAKTQSALFEVMEERQVTIDGETHEMKFPFFVIATQNPLEQEGTYRLPEAQLDRFLFRIKMSYPAYEGEMAILERFSGDFEQRKAGEVQGVLPGKELRELRNHIETITISRDILEYIARIVQHTRESPDLHLGASPRASLAMLKTAKVNAALNARNFVVPEDIHKVVYPVLNHRIVLSPEREMEGSQPEDVIAEILQKIEVPR